MQTLLKLFSLKLITAILGVFYSILQVRLFGASREIEVYFGALSLAYLVTSLTQSGQLAEIFLPEYHKLKVKSNKIAHQGLNVVINRMLLYGSVLILIIFLSAPYFIDLLIPGFEEKDKILATSMFRVLLPYLAIQLVSSFFITVLNAEKKFGRAEFLGLLNTIINIIILLAFFPILGVWSLELIFYIHQLYRNGFRYSLIISLDDFDHVKFFKAIQSTLFYVGATQIYSFVLTASISYLPEGTFAIFKYVQNLSNKVKGLFIQPFITIFFTTYSQLAQVGKSVTNEMKRTITNIINVNIILCVGTILMGKYIIDFIWGGNKFDDNDVNLAYLFLLFNVVAIVFSSLGSVYRKMAVSHGKSKALYSCWVISQLLSALFTYFLLKYFAINGLYFIIPINTFLMGVVSFLVYRFSTKEDAPQIRKASIYIGISLIIIACLFNFSIFSRVEITNLRMILGISLFTTALISYPLYSIYLSYKQ
jgi:putative peptidoglycan lipid II flippase